MSGLYLGSKFPADSGVVFDLDALVGVFDVVGLAGVLGGVFIGVLGLLLDDAVVVVSTLLKEDAVPIKALLLEEDTTVVVG